MAAHPPDLAAYVQKFLEKRHTYHLPLPNSIRIGPRRDVGVYTYYDVSYFAAANHAKMEPGQWMIQGDDSVTLCFDNDMEDAALRSASL